MIKITKHTSNICGCITWYEWDTDDDEGSRVHTDIAVAPCKVHDPVNFGKTLVDDATSDNSKQLVSGSTINPVEFVSDIRPPQIKDVIPLSSTIVARNEMYLQEETRSVLLQVDEISQEEFDDNLKPVGRKFKDGINAGFSFNEDRKLVVSLEGAEVSEKDIAQTVLNDSSLDTGLIILL